MFKHNIKYTDYNGTERNEVFYFNLSKAELMEMELSTQAGVDEMIRMMIATNDNAKIVQTFKDLILSVPAGEINFELLPPAEAQKS